MSNIWILLAVIIVMGFLINLKKGVYYLFPLIILLSSASRFLYSLTGFGTINMLSVSTTIVVIIYFAYSLKLTIENRSKLAAVDKAILAYIFWSFFMMILGFFSATISMAFSGFLNTVLPISVYFIIRFGRVDHNRLFYLILFSMSMLLLWDAYQTAFGYFSWESAYSNFRNEQAMEFTSKNPSGYEASFTAAMLFAVLAVMHFFKKNERFKYANRYLLITGLFFFVVLERTPLAAMIMAPFLIIIFWGTEKKALAGRLFATILIVGAVLIFTNVVIPRLDKSDKRQRRLTELGDIRNSNNILARMNRWERSSSYLYSPRIIIGYGLGFYAGDISYATHRGLHNELYNQIIEYGIIGLILLFFIYYKIILLVNMRNKPFLLPYFSGLLAFWIIAMVNSPFLNNTKYYHWLFIGMIVSNFLSIRESEFKLRQYNG